MSKTNRFISAGKFNIEFLSLFILLIGHTIAAYTSYGFHHPDEHFQILEWANYYVGLGDPNRLAWEFAAQIRPWFQPMLHAIFVKAFLGLGIYNAFDAAFFFRLLYGYLNIYTVFALWRFFKPRYQLSSAWMLWISLLWFFPYIHVRTSSENLSGVFLSFALIAILRNQRYFLSGILFGFSFLARYQIALGLFGLGLALIYRDRKIVREHWKLLAGFILPVAFGMVLDRVGYGNWVFTAYRYFKVNLVDGVAATYNPYPWYQYFLWVLQLNPIVSIPLFAGAIVFLKKGLRDDRLIIGSFVWSFFLLHCLITNKEYRFLLPIINLVPFMTAVAFQGFESKLFKKSILIPYAAISLIAFMVSSLHGASLRLIGSAAIVDRYHHEGDTWISNRNYRDLGPNEQYYSKSVPVPTLYQSTEELQQLVEKHPNSKVLVDGKLDDQITKDFLGILENHGCRVLGSTMPRWFYEFRHQVRPIGNMAYQVVYDCTPKN